MSWTDNIDPDFEKWCDEQDRLQQKQARHQTMMRFAAEVFLAMLIFTCMALLFAFIQLVLSLPAWRIY
jgi:hypothetical protein